LNVVELVGELITAAGRQLRCLQESQEAAFFGSPDRQVFGADHAVDAASRLASIDERAAVSVGDDGVLDALGRCWVGFVEGAVVELAESDRQPCLAQQVVLVRPGLSGQLLNG
jgi:hypothetical protein